jgi:FkbM family methyltransferase
MVPDRLKPIIRPYYKTACQIIERRFLSTRPSRIAIETIGGFDLAYRENSADEAVILNVVDNDSLFSQLPEYRPRAGHVIIDIGAHIGTFAILCAREVNDGTVHAIEASRDSYNLLRINSALNHCGNISSHHLAINDRNGTCTLYHARGNWGHSVVKKLSRSWETVESCTLASFFERNQIDRCDFMKLNCEGGEFPILLSSPTDLLGRIDTILVLYHCDKWKNHTESDLVAHLRSSGFDCAVRNRTKMRGWIFGTRPSQ